MQAGLLNNIIKVQKRVYSEDNKFNEQEETYIDYLTIRARVKYSSGSRSIENKEVFINYSPEFIIRIYHKIDETMIILYNDKKYRIVSIEPDIKLQSKTIITELINE